MRRNKYGARKVEIDGIKFDSQAESRRYLVLKDMQERGEIQDLSVHPKYDLQAPFVTRRGKKVRGITYTADFLYTMGRKVIVEDVKGGRATQTAAFRIKAKLFQKQYPWLEFEVVES